MSKSSYQFFTLHIIVIGCLGIIDMTDLMEYNPNRLFFCFIIFVSFPNYMCARNDIDETRREQKTNRMKETSTQIVPLIYI